MLKEVCVYSFGGTVGGILCQKLKKRNIKVTQIFSKSQYASIFHKIDRADVLVVVPLKLYNCSEELCKVYPTSAVAAISYALAKGKPVYATLRLKVKHFSGSMHVFDKKKFIEKYQDDDFHLIQPEMKFDGNGDVTSIDSAPWQTLLSAVCHNFLLYANRQNEIKSDTLSVLDEYLPVVQEIAKKMQMHKAEYDDGFDTIAVKVPMGGIVVTSLDTKVDSITKEDLVYVRSWENEKIEWEGFKCPSQSVPLITRIFENSPEDNVIVSGSYNNLINNPSVEDYTTVTPVLGNMFSGVSKIMPKLQNNGAAVIRMGDLVMKAETSEMLMESMDSFFLKVK